MTARKLGLTDTAQLAQLPMIDTRVMGVKVNFPGFWNVVVPAAQCALDRACVSAVECGSASAISTRVHITKTHYEESLDGIVESISTANLEPMRRCSQQPWPLPEREE